MEILKTQYQTIHFIEKKKMFEWVWNKDTLFMSGDDFKNETLQYGEQVLKYKPQFLFINTLEMQFVIVPELQVWYSQHIATKTFAAGVQKIAFLVSEDIFVKMSVQQTDEEIAAARQRQNPTMQVRYFDLEQEARNWLC